LIENDAHISEDDGQAILRWIANGTKAVAPDAVLDVIKTKGVSLDPEALAEVIRSSGPAIPDLLDSLLVDYIGPERHLFHPFVKLDRKVKTFDSAKAACNFSKEGKPKCRSKVSVQLQHVPSKVAALEALTSDHVVRALGDVEDLSVLGSNLAKAIVSERWKRVQTQNSLDIFNNLIVVVCACVAAAELRTDGAVSTVAVIALLAFMVAKRVIEEVDHNVKLVLAFWFGMLWLRLLFSFRTVSSVGPRFLPIFFAIRETMPFFLVVAFCLSGAVHAYYTVGARSDPFPFYAAFMQVFRLGVMGDFDMYEFEGQDAVLVRESENTWAPEDPPPSEFYVGSHILFYTISFGVAIVLMNLLIGVLGTNYDTYEDLAQQLFLRERARTILNFETRPWRCWNWNCWRRCRAGPKDDSSANQELFVIVRQEASQDEQRSMRSVFKAEVAKHRDDVNARMDDLDKHVQDLGADVNTTVDNLSNRVNTTVDNLSNRVNTTVDNLSNRVNTRMDKLDKQLIEISELLKSSHKPKSS